MSERLPGTTFFRRLERILEHVDATSSFTASWKDFLFHERCTSTFRVLEVHVVGSFARGALECGDLDLVVKVDVIAGEIPPERTTAGLVSRRSPRVQVHIGTPEKNSSRAKFPEAVLLWSTKDRDWRARIAALPVDPTAGRFERKTDLLPLRLAQLRLYDFALAERAVDRITAGELASHWHPVSAITPAPASWRPYLSDLAKGFREMPPGKETARMLPCAIQRLAELGVTDDASWAAHANTRTTGIEQKAKVAAEITDSIVRNTQTDAKYIYVIFDDVRQADWAGEGKLFGPPGD